MGRCATVAQSNIYYQARKMAASCNAAFGSREGAAELMNLSVDSLNSYELGYGKVVPADKAALMAQVYGAPQLLNYYCAYECPVGQARGMQMIDDRNIEQTALSFMLALQTADATLKKLVGIVADGRITPNEVTTLFDVVDELKAYAQLYEELKILMEKVGTS